MMWNATGERAHLMAFNAETVIEALKCVAFQWISMEQFPDQKCRMKLYCLATADSLLITRRRFLFVNPSAIISTREKAQKHSH